MSKNRPHAVTTAIISHNVPVNREPYDPKELILDMPAAYHFGKICAGRPEIWYTAKAKGKSVYDCARNQGERDGNQFEPEGTYG